MCYIVKAIVKNLVIRENRNIATQGKENLLLRKFLLILKCDSLSHCQYLDVSNNKSGLISMVAE
jgi:hypothetical protein